jgi:hypothetical protein
LLPGALRDSGPGSWWGLAMDTRRFDDLTRRLGRAVSRRTALGGLLAVVTGSASVEAAGARRAPRCRTVGASCTQASHCCSGLCPTGRRTPLSRRNRCSCLEGQRSCRGQCADLATDPRHCGACGNACPGGVPCEAGVCACPVGQTRCGDACVDLQTDATHCGDCGSVCDSDAICASGWCVCPDGQTDCDGACVDTATNVDFCGACDVACGPGETCESGACACGDGGGCGDVHTCISGVCKVCEIASGSVGCFRTVEDDFESWQLGNYQGLPGQGPLACASSSWCVDNYLDTCRDGTYDCFCITGYSTAAEPDRSFPGPSVCGWALR